MRIDSVLGYEFVTVLIFAVFLTASLFLFIYGLMQAHLVYQYLKAKRKGNANLVPSPAGPLTEYPYVTVQLPVYNEQYVMERLIDAVARLRYPKDRLEVQVLDDSTDESVAITARKVAEWQRTGLDIQQIRRGQRTGYKAGALEEALPNAKGEFIAIFDADFVPEPDFLEKTLPAFTGPEVGMVQTRWDHLNKGYSLLTHIQSFLIDAHFSIEQAGRNACGYFINFSGTGGVWRKTCIIDAGGWNSDTLTEDFDLSYRAQLKGWKFRYLKEALRQRAEGPCALARQNSRSPAPVGRCGVRECLPVFVPQYSFAAAQAPGAAHGVPVRVYFLLDAKPIFPGVVSLRSHAAHAKLPGRQPAGVLLA
jgi:cellulose synthase/poly-beta-1,6-N-acetylglucosamine synthase-like glycosyltransferase